MTRKLPTLHALRGLAALAVVLPHAAFILDQRWWGALIPLGTYGVNVFFLLSGFLMVWVTQGKRGVCAAVRFARARIRRTVPPYWIALIVSWLFYTYFPVDGFPVPALTADRLWQNMLTVDRTIVPVSWSLAYEWVFYAVFCVACVLLGLRIWWWGVPWAMYVLCVRAPHLDGVLSLGSTHFLWLLMGAAIGDVVMRTWRLRVLAFRDGFRTYPQWLMVTADYSYAIYLMHWPALWAIRWVRG